MKLLEAIRLLEKVQPVIFPSSVCILCDHEVRHGELYGFL